eukprot:978390-Prorocentrum_minimum.AAC.3
MADGHRWHFPFSVAALVQKGGRLERVLPSAMQLGLRVALCFSLGYAIGCSLAHSSLVRLKRSNLPRSLSNTHYNPKTSHIHAAPTSSAATGGSHQQRTPSQDDPDPTKGLSTKHQQSPKIYSTPYVHVSRHHAFAHAPPVPLA